jgi:hypothetical protein
MTVAAKSNSSSQASPIMARRSANRRAKRKLRMLCSAIGWLSVERTSSRLASTSGPVGSARIVFTPQP